MPVACGVTSSKGTSALSSVEDRNHELIRLRHPEEALVGCMLQLKAGKGRAVPTRGGERLLIGEKR